MRPLTKLAWEAVLHLAHLVWESASYATVFLCAFFSPQGKLAAQIIALRSQVAACRGRVDRKQVPKPRSAAAFRVLWVMLSRIQPATVKRWHRAGFSLYWRWRSWEPGQPPISAEMQKLVRSLSPD